MYTKDKSKLTLYDLMLGLILVTLVGAYAVAELYKKYATPAEKRSWQNFVNMHHGEAGTIITTAGLLTKSPKLIGSGLGLMFHDKADSNKWFQTTRVRF